MESLLNQAQEGKIQILIPTLVMAELMHIAEKGKVKVTVEQILQQINQGYGFTSCFSSNAYITERMEYSRMRDCGNG